MPGRRAHNRRWPRANPRAKPDKHRFAPTRHDDPAMTLHVALTHRTQYRYDRLVGLSAHEIRLRPAPHCRTPILSYSLKVLPEKHFINWQQDVYGNFIARLVFPEKTRELEITVDLLADMTVINPFDFFV